jgi:hypothetical protein
MLRDRDVNRLFDEEALYFERTALTIETDRLFDHQARLRSRKGPQLA